MSVLDGVLFVAGCFLFAVYSDFDRPLSRGASWAKYLVGLGGVFLIARAAALV